MKIKVSHGTKQTAKVYPSSTNQVVSVGVQGPPGAQGTPGPSSISLAGDVDATNLQNGSILVYKTQSNKWTSTTVLDSQNLEGGEF